MTRKNSLYAVLGIDKTSDKKSIKNAYRKMAKKTHPDVSKNSEQFALVKKAHDILMDDRRRELYDSTGDEAENPPDNALGNAINCIAFHFNSLLQKLAESGTSPLTVDMVSRIKSEINQSISENQKNLRITKSILDFDKKMVGRFRKNLEIDGNVFESIILNRIHALKTNISNLENAIKTHQQALEMINGFTYKSDEVPYESPGDRMMNLMSGSNFMGW